MTPAKSIGGSTEQMLDTIGQWQAIGVDHILLDPVAPGGFPGRMKAMESFMTDVAPPRSAESGRRRRDAGFAFAS